MVPMSPKNELKIGTNVYDQTWLYWLSSVKLFSIEVTYLIVIWGGGGGITTFGDLGDYVNGFT